MRRSPFSSAFISSTVAFSCLTSYTITLLELPLSFTGHINLDFTVKVTVPDGNAQRNIKYIGQIPRNEVFANLCEGALIFPSYIETFGYPLIEAAQMGAIVLAADCDYAHEVLSGYENVYYFNPFEPKELAILIEKVISGEIERFDTFKKVEESNNTWEDVVNEIISTKKEI